LATVSVLALTALALTALGLSSCRDEDAKPVISFRLVHKSLDGIIKDEIVKSQNDFGVKYSASDIESIKNRIWDRAQAVLLEHYEPGFKPPTPAL
jgi:hypothetical protein